MRLMREEEAIEISRCAYISHGYSFFDDHIYYPHADSSLVLLSAARCLMKNVTRPNGRDEWQIEEATERGN